MVCESILEHKDLACGGSPEKLRGTEVEQRMAEVSTGHTCFKGLQVVKKKKRKVGGNEEDVMRVKMFGGV